MCSINRRYCVFYQQKVLCVLSTQRSTCPVNIQGDLFMCSANRTNSHIIQFVYIHPMALTHVCLILGLKGEPIACEPQSVAYLTLSYFQHHHGLFQHG